MSTESALQILIVEDDRTSRFVLRRILEAIGNHEVHEAEDGLKAWDRLSEGWLPDLCFLDLNMPRLNGIELLRRIRADPRLAGLKVCFCSAVRERHLIVQAAALKPCDYILKPYSREAIFAQVQRILGAPNPGESLEPETGVCMRLGIDHATYQARLDALLEEVRSTTGRLPTLLMRFDVVGVMTALERARSAAQQLGARRIFRLVENLRRAFEREGGMPVSREVSREEANAQFQQWLSRSADHLMQGIQELRAEVQTIEKLGQKTGLSGAPGSGGRPGGLATPEEQELEIMVQALAEVFQRGRLVSASRSNRSRSLSVPIKAALFGEDSAQTLGAVTRKTSFSLTILDPDTAKAVEECRKVTDLVKFLSLPLDGGARWIPDGAVGLLEGEAAARNSQGLMLLRHAIGDDIEAFLGKQESLIRENLNLLHSQSGIEGQASEAQVQAILADVEERLRPALNGHLTHEVLFTTLDLGNLLETKDDERWVSPCLLLHHSALLQREAYADPSFDRTFKFSTFDRQRYLQTMDVFGDAFSRHPDAKSAVEGIKQLDSITASPVSQLEKCRLIWALIRPTAPTASPA